MIKSKILYLNNRILQSTLLVGSMCVLLILTISCQGEDTEATESNTLTSSATFSETSGTEVQETEASESNTPTSSASSSETSSTEAVTVLEDENEYFEVVSKDYSDGILTFTLKNISSRLLDYGQPTRVEELVDGEWSEVNTNVGYTMERLQSSPLLEIKVKLPLFLWEPSADAEAFRMAIPVEVQEGIDVMIPFEYSDLE